MYPMYSVSYDITCTSYTLLYQDMFYWNLFWTEHADIFNIFTEQSFIRCV